MHLVQNWLNFQADAALPVQAATGQEHSLSLLSRVGCGYEDFECFSARQLVDFAVEQPSLEVPLHALDYSSTGDDDVLPVTQSQNRIRIAHKWNVL